MGRTLLNRPARGSAGGRALAREMSIRMLRNTGSHYVYRPGDRIINWGSTQMVAGVPDEAYVNHPAAVARAVDKRMAWELLQRAVVRTVEYTDDWSIARAWMAQGHRLLVRTSLQASQGRGIVMYSEQGTDWTKPACMYERTVRVLPGARDPLAVFVKAFGTPKQLDEFRVHVVHGEVVDYAMKKRSREYDGTAHPYIRSHDKGWVLCREGVTLIDDMAGEAVRAVAALGLDFGAVDIALNKATGDVCVYEVNTAPGLEGTTLGSYAEALA